MFGCQYRGSSPGGRRKGQDWGRYMKRLLKHFARDTSGNATVEFVIWLPMVLLAFGLTVDVSMIFHSQSQVLRIVQDANRNASIGRLRTAAEAESYIETRLQKASSGADAVGTPSSVPYTSSSRVGIQPRLPLTLSIKVQLLPSFRPMTDTTVLIAATPTSS